MSSPVDIEIKKVIFSSLPKDTIYPEYGNKRVFSVIAKVNDTEKEYLITPNIAYLFDLFIEVGKKITKSRGHVLKTTDLDEVIHKIKDIRTRVKESHKNRYSKKPSILKVSSFHQYWYERLANSKEILLTIRTQQGEEVDRDVYRKLSIELFSHKGTKEYWFGNKNITKIEFKPFEKILESHEKESIIKSQESGIVPELFSWEIEYILRQTDRKDGKLDLLKPMGPSWEDFREPNAYIYERPEVKQIIEMLERSDDESARVVIEGNAASGKSTILKNVGIKWHESGKGRVYYISLQMAACPDNIGIYSKLSKHDLLILDNAHLEMEYIERILWGNGIKSKILIATREKTLVNTISEKYPAFYGLSHRINVEVNDAIINKVAKGILAKKFQYYIPEGYPIVSRWWYIDKILADYDDSLEVITGAFSDLWLMVYILEFTERFKDGIKLNSTQFIKKVRDRIIDKLKKEYHVISPLKVLYPLVLFSSKGLSLHRSFLERNLFIKPEDIETLIDYYEIIEKNDYLTWPHSSSAKVYLFCLNESKFIENIHSLFKPNCRPILANFESSFMSSYVDFCPYEVSVIVRSSNDINLLVHCILEHWQDLEKDLLFNEQSLMKIIDFALYADQKLVDGKMESSEQREKSTIREALTKVKNYLSWEPTIRMLIKMIENKQERGYIERILVSHVQLCRGIKYNIIPRTIITYFNNGKIRLSTLVLLFKSVRLFLDKTDEHRKYLLRLLDKKRLSRVKHEKYNMDVSDIVDLLWEIRTVDEVLAKRLCYASTIPKLIVKEISRWYLSPEFNFGLKSYLENIFSPLFLFYEIDRKKLRYILDRLTVTQRKSLYKIFSIFISRLKSKKWIWDDEDVTEVTGGIVIKPLIELPHGSVFRMALSLDNIERIQKFHEILK